jgi:hypothetical protein
MCRSAANSLFQQLLRDLHEINESILDIWDEATERSEGLPPDGTDRATP